MQFEKRGKMRQQKLTHFIFFLKCGIFKDTDLYRLYNTNIHEKIAEQKKREMQIK